MVDARVQHTTDALTGAISDLGVDHDLPEITVEDVCQHSGVSPGCSVPRRGRWPASSASTTP